MDHMSLQIFQTIFAGGSLVTLVMGLIKLGRILEKVDNHEAALIDIRENQRFLADDVQIVVGHLGLSGVTRRSDLYNSGKRH